MSNSHQLAQEILRLRKVQLEINDLIISGRFKVPVHLALGHEALAVGVNEAMAKNDQILLNHRNIHYHLALGATQEQLIAEYDLSSEGLANGKFGSMNLVAPKNRNIYTSNILGNNLAVALGVAQSELLNNQPSSTWVVTGDGAIEEGIFYESLLSASTWNLPIIYIVENNRWSLGTEISARRTEIDLSSYCASVGITYKELKGNDVQKYTQALMDSRVVALERGPVLIEVHLETLGGFFVEEETGKRYINYHAGKAKLEDKNIMIHETDSDPVFVNQKYLESVGI
jgi:TPP-dependent pyruvate/acetoin dehydrogenase alpha subunit